MGLVEYPVKQRLPHFRGFLTGPGLSCFYGIPPVQDLLDMGIQWIRVDTSGASVTNAGIDKFITGIEAYGIKIDWLLSVSPVAGGAYAVPSALAQQILARYAAAGITRPVVFELGNEVIQLYFPPGGSDFANEATAETAYAVCVNSMMTAMAGYNCVILGANDEPAYVKACYDYIVAAGTAHPDGWGYHNYSNASTDEPGTFELLQEILGASCVNTEGNEAVSGVTKTQAKAWFTTLRTAMGVRPWCYYPAYDSTYDASTNAVGWYSHQTFDGNGIAIFDTRTATLTELATAIGANVSWGT